MSTRLARCLRPLIAVAVATSIAVSIPGTASAVDSVHITGTVSSQAGGGLQNVSVTATAPGLTTTLFGPALTAANGSYQLDVDPGTYDVHFTPPTGSGLNPISNTNFVATSDRTLNVQLTPPSRTMSGTLRDSTGQPVPSLTLTFRNVNTNAGLTITTNASGQYTAIANAGIYYLANLSNDAQPLGSVYLSNLFSPSTMPNYDLTNNDLAQDFQLPTATLTITVKDGFGNPVPNAPVTISSNSNVRIRLTPSDTPSYYNLYNRNGTTNSTGIANITAFNATYPPGHICATITGNQTCNTTPVTINGNGDFLFQSAPQVPPAPGGLSAPTPTTSAPALTWSPVSVASSYRVYRNGVLAGTTTGTSFVDTGVSGGSYTYTVTAVSALNIESPVSNAFMVVYRTGPAVSNVVANPSTVGLGLTAVLSATITTATGTVTAAEYFEGTDPGEGQGVPMALSGSTASATLPGTLALGAHTFTVRGRDDLGNWSRGGLPTAQLTVALPTLNGRVLDGANIGIANVRVDIVDPDNHATVIASTTTNGSGNYSLSFTAGTYDVIYTPPGTIYQPTTKTGIDLTVSATVDVVLVLQPKTFSGTVKDGNDTPIPGVILNLHNQGGQTVTTTTAGDGSFSVSVNPATYSLTISGTKAAAPAAFVPNNFTLTGGAFDLTSHVDRDFVIDAAEVTFTTKSALTEATVGQVLLNVSTSTTTTVYTGSGNYSGSANYLAATDTAGVAKVVVLVGSLYSVTALPPPGSGVVLTLFPQAGPVTGPVERDLLLTADIRHLRGVFRDGTGAPIPAATVRLSGPLGAFQAVTNATGDFDVEAAAGTYTMTVSGSKPSGSTLRIPDSFSFTGASIDISVEDKVQDLTLPAAIVTVTAQSAFGATLSNVGIQLVSVAGSVQLYPGGMFTASASSTKQTDDEGRAEIVVATGLAYTTKATPPAGGGYLVTNLPASPIVNGDTSWTVTLNRDLKRFTGVVRDKNGVAVQGATVRLDGNEQDQHYSVVTGSDGAFGLDVAPNSAYSLRVSGTQAASTAAYLPDNFVLSTTTSVTADMTQDITVRAVRLDILARDDRLSPIANVGITFSSSGSQNGYTASSSAINRTTASNGETHVTMLEGTTYTIHAVPPPAMGYINTTFNGTSPIVQDAQAIIEFQNHIPLPPEGLTATSPTKIYPVLTWSPTINADHYKVYRGTTFVGAASSTSFTDSSLAADGTYSYRVSAVSAQGYEGPKSAPATVVYDTTAPVVGVPLLSVNPKRVNESTVLSATVTDGAGSGVASGEYFIGTTDPGEGSATEMALTGGILTATLGTTLRAGDHVISVRAKDILDTWSTIETITLTVSRPQAPTGLTAPTPTNTDPALAWTASPDAVKYRVYRDGVALSTEPATTSFVDLGLADDTYSYTVTAVNELGDESDPSDPVSVLVDRIAPTIMATAYQPPANGYGWNNTSVIVTFTCDDDSSGIAFCHPPVTVPGHGANQIVNAHAIDLAGNRTDITVTGINIDIVKPDIEGTLTPQPTNDWHNTDVTVSFTCTDDLSTIAECTGPVTMTNEGFGQAVPGTAKDKADNTRGITMHVNIDKTAPVPGTPSWSSNPKSVAGSTILAVSAPDNLSGTSGGEYFVDADPGVGNGIPMSLSGNTLTATIGTGLAVGVYRVGVRARDTAGNWSQPAYTMLVVYDPALTIGITGRNKKDLIPSLVNGDVLPGLTQPNQNDAADYGFTVDFTNGALDPRNDFMFTYNTGSQCNSPQAQNCHSFSVSVTGFAWLVIDQTNNSRGRFQGTATVTVDGVTTSNPFTVEGIDGDRLNPATDDRLTLKIYAPGTDPTTAAPIYQASGFVPKGNAVRVR